MLKKGGGGVRGGGVLKNHRFVRGQNSGTSAGWDFAKNLKESKKSQWPLLMTFCPPSKLVIKANKKSFPRKNHSFTARRVSKMAFDSTAH
jgi:hypothetical protein